MTALETARGTVWKLGQGYAASLYRRSLQVPTFLKNRMALVAGLWLLFAAPFALFRLATPASPVHGVYDALPILLSYSAIMAAPICGFLLARAAFDDKRARQPLDFHLSFVGKWKRVDADEARSHPFYGPVGFLASLLIGMLLNVVVRSGEFFVAVPAMSMHAPEWGLTLFGLFTFDLVVMNFFYMVAFVMALRSVPLFPRMLLFVWMMDIFMQVLIGFRMAHTPGLPAEVVAPLVALLKGNLIKVLISMTIWLPYLIVSHRVNVTYRSRLPA